MWAVGDCLDMGIPRSLLYGVERSRSVSALTPRGEGALTGGPPSFHSGPAGGPHLNVAVRQPFNKTNGQSVLDASACLDNYALGKHYAYGTSVSTPFAVIISCFRVQSSVRIWSSHSYEIASLFWWYIVLYARFPVPDVILHRAQLRMRVASADARGPLPDYPSCQRPRQPRISPMPPIFYSFDR